MANELLAPIGISSLSVSARLYLAGVLAATVSSCPELSGQGGLYAGNMSALAAGEYAIQFFSNGVVVCTGSIDWDGIHEVTLESINAQLVSAAAPPLVVGTLTCRDINYQPLGGVVCTLAFINGETDGRGTAFLSGYQTATSASNGLVQFNMWPGATYQIRRGTTGDWVQFVAQSINFSINDCIE